MREPNKYRRLYKAINRFDNFHRFVDFITIVLFLATAVAVSNKLLTNKIVDLEFFQWSWRTIVISTCVFLSLFAMQSYHEGRSRFMSSFQKEAALKAARKNNYRRRYR